MSRRLPRISLVLVVFLTSEVWALGLGDIRLDSALNEPLRAEIELLSATPEELDNLAVALASSETFERYGLDRPFYLQDIQFLIVRSGRSDGNTVQLRSTSSMSEPFLTFLVEATWSRGRLLREYTVLLDPPTYAPPATDTAPAVQAPRRSAPADSARIERAAPAPADDEARPAPRPAPVQPPATSEPKPEPVADDTPYDAATGGDYVVQRSETLWGIATRVRPDSRLSMNQTMLAIFEANPDAFGGNINILRAGAELRIPSADEIFRIDRGDALAEAQRQHAAWSGTAAPVETESRPSLTLVPPDEDYTEEATAPIDTGYDTEPYTAEPATREADVLDRIAELEAADVPQQQSLIEIRDNELAALREELARIRGEEYVPPVDEVAADEVEPLAEDAGVIAEDAVEEGVAGAPDAEDIEDTAADTTPPPTTIIQSPRRDETPGLVDQALDIMSQWWVWIIGGVVIVVGALLFWFMRRSRHEDDDVDSWQPLDSEGMEGDLSATESMRAPVGEESIVVVEQQSAPKPQPLEDTVEAEAQPEAQPEPQAAPAKEATGTFDSLEDTFSSETAVNLDQTDPIAEADFHMAYGLYDQAADLINGALEVEPTRPDLLTKLCEIYFVWGNRDAFIDAAGKLKAAVGGSDSADWDKIVIMGQQIAADDELFSGASAAGATKVVDLEFEGDMQDAGALDMELIADSDSASDVFDVGASDSDETAAVPSRADESAVDFVIDDDAMPDSTADADLDVTRELPVTDNTAEMPVQQGPMDSPTIEQHFDTLGGTSELPSFDESGIEDKTDSGRSAEATAEINLDDLGLDVDGLPETELASLDDSDATGAMESLSDTAFNEVVDDTGATTGRNREIDPDATGVRQFLGTDDTGINEQLSDTGINEELDESLLDATGVTQVLGADQAVDTTADAGADNDEDATMLSSEFSDDSEETTLHDDQDTLLASLDDDADDFDFAKTEALPKEAFTGDHSLDETGELPAVASTDVDLDLDDLTAALQVSDAAGDTVEQVRDDATVEQPRPATSSEEEDNFETMSLSEDDMSDDLHDARTMTEVGTKLDLARAYVDMGDPSGARSILEEVLDEGDEAQRQQAQQLLDSLPA